MDLLDSGYSNCQFYVGDTQSRSADASKTAVKQQIQRLTEIYPNKNTLRRDVVNNAIGYVERFTAFLNTYMEQRYLAPIEAVLTNPDSPSSVQSKLKTVLDKNTALRANLDQRDADMTSSVDEAWQANKATITDLAVKTASLLKKSEDSGVSMINAEMSNMYKSANRAVTENMKLINQLGRDKVKAANSSAKSVVSLANYLWKGSNDTLSKANIQFTNMNNTLATLEAAKATMQSTFAQIEADVTQDATQKFITAQNQTGYAQLVASGAVDSTLMKMAAGVTKALAALTADEKKSLTSISTVTGRQLQDLSTKIASFTSDAARRAASIKTAYTNNITGTSQVVNSLFSNIDLNLQGVMNEITRANSSVTSTRGYMDSSFGKLDTDVAQMFANQTQTAALKKTDLDSWMDRSLNTFKGVALNASRDGSASLKQAFDAAMSAVTTGSDALSMNFDQRKAVIAALQKWQSDYKGNTDKLVSSFSSTYTGLVADTDSQMKNAIAAQQSNIVKAQADQAKAIQDAVAASQGDPAKLQALLAQFGLVGDAAAAAAKNIQLNLNTSSGTMTQAQKDATTALGALLQASSANSDAYKQAAAMNTQASSVAGAAVANVTNRLAVMNSMMKQYSDQIGASLFDATNGVAQDVNANSANQSATVTAAIQAKMVKVQEMLTQAISKGQMSSAEIAQFAASIGANATALSAIVSSLRTDSSSGLSDILKVKQDAIDGLKTQVGAQMDSINANFQASLSGEQTSMNNLFNDMKADLANQAGSKSSLLMTKRDFLQQLFGQLTSSSIERDAASKALDKQFSDAEAKVSTSLPQLAAQIQAQQTRVNQAIQDKQAALTAASLDVNGTIADTNATAVTELAALRKTGDEKIATVQQSLNDASGTVAIMVKRYQDTMQKYLDADREQRVQENANEISQIFKVRASLNASQEAQASALATRNATSAARAAALAEIVGTLSGASTAARGGQTAFIAYVKALADKSGVDMAELVSQMKTQVAAKKGALYDMLNANGLFVSGTLDALAQSAGLIQQGVVDGTTDVLANVKTSLANSNALSAAQTGALNGLAGQNSQLTAITGAQLTQLMTVLLAQSALQQSNMSAAQKAAISRTATIQDATGIFGQALDDATKADLDAIQAAADLTDDIDTETRTLVKATTDAALQEASTYTTAADSDYTDIKQALDDAGVMMQAFNDRLNQAETTFKQEKPAIESQVAAIKTDMQTLETTVDQNQAQVIDRVNTWATNTQKNALDQLTKLTSNVSTTR